MYPAAALRPLKASGFTQRGAGRRDQGGTQDLDRSHRHVALAKTCLDLLNNLLTQAVFLQRAWKTRIVAPSGIWSLYRLIPANRRVAGTLTSASTIAGAMREHH
jgi:hypothetical protein